MEKTSNYNLIKPAGNEGYDIEQFNTNMDIIDGAIKNVSTANAKKVDKVTNGTAGNMAVLTAGGGVADSGLRFSIYNGGLRITYDDGL